MNLPSFLFRPSIKATLIGGQKAKVTVTHPDRENTMILLYSIVRQVAPMMGYNHREVINKLLALDTVIAKDAKKRERDDYRAEQQVKHSRKK